MLENIFITGTAKDLIIKMGTNTDFLTEKSFYHTVSSSVSRNNNVTHLGLFTAPLVCAYAKTKLSQLSSVIICLRVPEINSFDNLETTQTLDNAFHIEWYFTLDLIHQSLLLFKHYHPNSNSITSFKHTNKRPYSRGKVFVCVPFVNKHLLNNAQLVYYNSIISAINTYITNVKTSNEIAIIYLQSDQNDTQNVESILQYIDSIQFKNIHKKTFHQIPWATRSFRFLQNK